MGNISEERRVTREELAQEPKIPLMRDQIQPNKHTAERVSLFYF
jgi:hypothetical protein